MNEQLWAPWRIKYILNEKEEGCVFCKKVSENNDEKNYILYRGKHAFVVLNLYPYNNGHLMVVPYRHIADFSRLNDNELCEMMRLVSTSTKALQSCMNPDGFNIGANIGAIAGAGIADHIHMHVVPRWSADTNFMPVLTSTNVIPESLDEAYILIKKAFEEVT